MITNIQIEESKRSILEAKPETIEFISKILCPLKIRESRYEGLLGKGGHVLKYFIPTRRTSRLLDLLKPKVTIRTESAYRYLWGGWGGKMLNRIVPNRIIYPLFCNMEDANKKLYLFGKIVSKVSEHSENNFTPYQETQYRDDKELSDLVREFQEVCAN